MLFSLGSSHWLHSESVYYLQKVKSVGHFESGAIPLHQALFTAIIAVEHCCYAAGRGHPKLCSLLIEYKANVYAKTKDRVFVHCL